MSKKIEMTTRATKEKSLYRAEFEDFVAGAGGGEPSWLESLRAAAFERFEETGFPTTDDEEWKYTNVAPLARRVFHVNAGPQAEPGAPEVEAFVYAESRRSRLVFVNGRLSRELSALEALPAGVLVGDIMDALEGERAEVVRASLLARAREDEKNAFAALNTAFLRSGAFVFIPQDVRIEAPVQILFLSTRAEAEPISAPRVLIIAERDSSATVIESYVAANDAAYFTNALVDVSVAEGARLVHYKVQSEADEAFHIASTHARLARSSSYELTTITLGARLSRHDIEVSLDEEGAQCRVDGLYIVSTGQHTDTHSLIAHRVPHCASRQNYKGILDGKSRAIFNGKVFVHEGAYQTDAQQSNKNLLLSPEARVDTKPQLEIFNDDVKCAHGATVGQLEEEEFFYLTSRGLHPDLARNLLTYGFAEEIVEQIKVESIRAQLDEAILNRLHARLEV